jgi:hypothetical protein
MSAMTNMIATRIGSARRLALVAGLVLAGCAVDAGPGYGYGGAVGVDYYEPYGAVYGGWDSGYNVGPYRARGDWHGGGRGVGASGPRSFHAAPGGGGPPSIPSGARGGAGGGHGGGGGGRR